MKLPLPFSPIWKVSVGPLVQTGKGLLPRELSLARDSIDELRVFCSGFELAVKPRLGEIWADTSLAFKNAGAHPLVWCREMTILLATQDKNTSPARCSCYKLGLQVGENKIGFRIRPDGTAHFGSLN